MESKNIYSDWNGFIDDEFERISSDFVGGKLFGNNIDINNVKEMVVAAYYFGHWNATKKSNSWIYTILAEPLRYKNDRL